MEVRRLIDRCLRKDAAERAQAAREVAAELSRLRSRPVRRVRPVWWAAAVLLMLAATFGVFWLGGFGK